MTSIRCLVLPARDDPYFVTIAAAETLEAFQKYVGGNIEGYPLNNCALDGDEDRELSLYVNEEGLLLGLPRNKHIPGAVGHAVLSICLEGEDVGFASDVTIDAAMDMLREAMRH